VIDAEYFGMAYLLENDFDPFLGSQSFEQTLRCAVETRWADASTYILVHSTHAWLPALPGGDVKVMASRAVKVNRRIAAHYIHGRPGLGIRAAFFSLNWDRALHGMSPRVFKVSLNIVSPATVNASGFDGPPRCRRSIVPCSGPLRKNDLHRDGWIPGIAPRRVRSRESIRGQPGSDQDHSSTYRLLSRVSNGASL